MKNDARLCASLRSTLIKAVSGGAVIGLLGIALPVTAPAAAAARHGGPQAAGQSDAAEKAERDAEEKARAQRALFHNALDKESARIKRKPTPITIEAALQLARPVKLPADKRFAPVETTLWSVDGYLTMAENREDGDVLLVLKDAKGNILTCELPDPEDVEDSPWHREIAAAHGVFDKRLKAMPAAERVKGPVHVRVTGIGYFSGNRPGSKSAHNNAFQIHPVTAIEVLK